MSSRSIFLFLAVIPLASAQTRQAATPQVQFATYLGGSGGDFAQSVSLDSAGNTLVTGYTTSKDFPVVNAVFSACVPDASALCWDSFVAKYDSSGKNLVYSTYFSSSRNDEGNSIVSDAQGNAYVAGLFGGEAAFILKLDPLGRLAGAASLAGSPFTTARAMAVDTDGNLVVTGYTMSARFYVLNPLQSQPGANSCQSAQYGLVPLDAFVAKFDRNLNLIFSTYLGGSGNDRGESIATDAAGNIYVAGTTSSADFPAVDAYQPAYGGGPQTTGECSGGDLFLTKLDPSGTRLLYSTFVGGASDEKNARVRVTPAGQVYLGGDSSGNSILRKFSASGKELVQEISLGSLGRDLTAVQTSTLAVDVAGRAFVSAINTAEVDPSGKLGAVHPLPGAPAGDSWVGPGGALVIAGTGGTAPYFITPVNAIQPDPASAQDAYVIKVAMNSTDCQTAVSLNGADFQGPEAAPESVVSIFGCGLADALGVAGPGTLPTQIGGVEAVLTDSNGQRTSTELYAVAPSQINLVLPAGGAAGPASIDVLRGGTKSATAFVSLLPVAPALFTATSNGAGVASAIALRVNADGTRVFPPVFTCKNGACSAVPLEFTGSRDRLYLSLYGTGIRGRSRNDAISVKAGGVQLPVLGADAQAQYAGLDQVNVEIPQALVGAGLVNLVMTVDGVNSNAVQIYVR
jgi:uncharacterized protein (TIGR03437 family)